MSETGMFYTEPNKCQQHDLIISSKNMIIFQPYHVICLAVLYIASGTTLFSSHHWLSYKGHHSPLVIAGYSLQIWSLFTG